MVWSYCEERKRRLGEEKYVCMEMDSYVQGLEGGQGQKTWFNGTWKWIRYDMKSLCLASADALDCHAWRGKIVRCLHADPGLPGASLGFTDGWPAIFRHNRHQPSLRTHSRPFIGMSTINKPTWFKEEPCFRGSN